MSLDPKDPWRQVAARSASVSKKREIPSFASEETHELELGGRKLVFHAVSGMALLRVQRHLGGAFARVMAAFGAVAVVGGQGGFAALEGALTDLLESAGEHPQAIGLLVLDALRDEEWNDAPSSPAAIDQFLGQTSGAALVAMLAALATVNAKAFAPFVARLTEAAQAAKAAAGSPEETPPEDSSESSS